MFFLIKSAFWLSIVFSCMTWPGADAPQALVRQTASELGMRAKTVLVEKASSACAARPRECLDLVQRTATSEQAGAHTPRPRRGDRFN